MRFATVFSLLATVLALFSREETVFSRRRFELTFFLDQNQSLPTLLQFRIKLARQLKSVSVEVCPAGLR